MPLSRHRAVPARRRGVVAAFGLTACLGVAIVGLTGAGRSAGVAAQSRLGESSHGASTRSTSSTATTVKHSTEATGVVVHVSGDVSASTRRALGSALGARVTSVVPLGGGQVAVHLDRWLPASAVTAALRAVEAVRGVSGASVDALAQADDVSTSPAGTGAPSVSAELPDDAYFGDQTNLWAGVLTPTPSTSSTPTATAPTRAPTSTPTTGGPGLDSADDAASDGSTTSPTDTPTADTPSTDTPPTADPTTSPTTATTTTTPTSSASTATTMDSTGDFSIDAPSLWRSTLGSSSVVVAVVDSGIVAHADLAGQTVPGYDMISDPRISRDGGGRDSNPSDPGSWSDGTYCAASDSTWHGTHVAGIIAAKRNNGIGISGIAPGVKIQPVRVMGQCGGSTSDILAGIRWASGGHVPGVPDDKTPAKVVNVSLSFPSATCPSDFQSVVDEARSRGVLVVASAGNQHDFVTTRSPANCDGVLSVGASDPSGRRATYSNAGPTLGIVAPGGQLPSQGPGIWSTIDKGTRGPKGSTYAAYAGTSMAAPAVSAAAALVDSLGTFTPAQVEQVLASSARTPPRYDGYYTCDVTVGGSLQHYCGAGILDLANIPAPLSRVAIGGATLSSTHAVGTVLDAVPTQWNGTPTAVTYRWLRDGVAVSGATAQEHTVSAADLGHTLSVRTSASFAGFPAFTSTSTARAVPRASSSVSLGLSSRTAHRRTTRVVATIRLSAQQGQAAYGTVRVYQGARKVATVTVTTGRAVTVRLPVFPSSGTVHVKATYLGRTHVAGASRSLAVRVVK